MRTSFTGRQTDGCDCCSRCCFNGRSWTNAAVDAGWVVGMSVNYSDVSVTMLSSTWMYMSYCLQFDAPNLYTVICSRQLRINWALFARRSYIAMWKPVRMTNTHLADVLRSEFVNFSEILAFKPLSAVSLWTYLAFSWIIKQDHWRNSHWAHHQITPSDNSGLGAWF